MRIAVLLLAVVALARFTSCTDSGTMPGPDDVVLSAGTVVLESPRSYLIRLDVPIEYANTTTVYPLNLPEAFRKNLLRVRLIGKIEADPTSQYTYLPLRLMFIERALP